jgi:hypothetical protein
MSRRLRTALVFVLLVPFVPVGAFAQDPPKKTAAIVEAAAVSAYEAKRWVEARDAYGELLRDFAKDLAKPKRDAITKRLAELDAMVGTLQIVVNEADADVVVDGAPAGKSPLPKPVTLTSGPHRVRVTKPGFAPFEQAPNVAGRGAGTLTVTLEKDARKSRLTVKEKANEAVRVLVDGVDMGPAPWSGDVDPGEHEIVLQSPSAKAAPEKVKLDPGQAKDLVLSVTSTTATLKVSVVDGKGLIRIDDKVVGEGVWSGTLPAGKHRLTVSREGFDPFEEEITLAERDTISRSITLNLPQTVRTGEIKEQSDAIDGLYGGVGLTGVTMPGGNGNDVQLSCEKGTPKSCESSTPKGAGLSGFVGYHWDPVGLELYLLGLYDQTKPTATFDQSPLNLNSDPARTESFAIYRAGGTGALRARVTFQTKAIRFIGAAGVGMSYRAAFLKRDVATPNGLKDTHVPDSITYTAPAISLDLGAGFRLGRPTTLYLSFSLLAESPRAFNQDTKVAPDPTRALGAEGKIPVAITTPGYQLASGAQVYTGISLGIMFGP